MDTETIVGNAIMKAITSKIKKSLKKEGYILNEIWLDGRDDLLYFFGIDITNTKNGKKYSGIHSIEPYGSDKGCEVTFTNVNGSISEEIDPKEIQIALTY